MLTPCSSCAVTAHRLAKLHICASRAGYAEPHMSVGRSPMPPPQAHRAQTGAVWTALILICATLTALAGAFAAFIMYVRPVLKVCCLLHLHCSRFVYRERERLPWPHCIQQCGHWHPAEEHFAHMQPDCPRQVYAITKYCCAFVLGCYTLQCFDDIQKRVLQRMEQAALATEVASKAMEQSAKEFEQTSLIFQADTPTMIAEIEAAAHEYRELGHTLNVMTAGFRGKNPVKDWSQLSMKRVAKDVSALTHVSHHQPWTAHSMLLAGQ